VNLEIRPGGLVRLEGRNGTGKSTLLRMIAGVSVPSKGAVTGRPVTGFVPERFPPALPFPAREYLAHIGRVHGMTGADLADRIQVCLDRLGGWEFVDVPLRNMSKGMCQKVAVAQALLPRSGLLVLDEAWTGLDVQARSALDAVVAERLADGGSVVFVDHDPLRLKHMKAERWRLEEGRARLVSAPDGDLEPAAEGAGAADSGTIAAAGDGEPADGETAGAEAAGPGEGGPGAAGQAAVLIEVDGYPPGAAEPQGLPGVLSSVRVGERLSVLTQPDASDSVLRVLMGAGEGVHVAGVRNAEAGR
jgi:ABC-type Mn2+/Zn2+ transport system ATPase subunit